ncbi:Bcr/CflA family drug resistance efflux transporter [Variovorax sp. WS11]|uniref:MFS transporter n=1 Tax=Variovorax sp. WS11 TaxID=1105204 RepID=UPI000D0CD125|nr:MFS transporter [Variovorax sp. WS11]NDZ18125.1 multidrug effflux MFS transporter [Variovorax sp. WS11]PSL79919.1 Bcr/CflA family drug resistance efflux transporter [Variovorax sp. WS11]
MNTKAPMGPALVIFVVTLATAVQPLGTDLYLAALPSIRKEYGAPVSVVQLTLAIVVFSFGVSQLLWGPAADRFGRRPVLLAGFVLYAAGAGMGALAQSIELLIAVRAMQGLGIAAAMVCARAMVRDLYEQQQGTHIMTVAMSVLACAVMLIPLSGALLTESLGWRSTLWSMALCGLGGAVLVLLRVPETVRALKPDALQLRPLFAGYARIARHPGFRSWTLLNSCGYAANFGFFSSSAYLFIETYGVSRTGFGLVIGGASVAYLIGTVLCRRWIAAHGIVTSVRRAGYLSLGAALLMIAPQLADAHTPATLAAGLWLMLLAYGIHQPCGHVGMATPFPLQAGAASALGGFIFATAAFACGTWMGLMYRSGSAAVLSLTTGVLAAATGLIALTLVQRHGRPEVARVVIP